MHRVDRKASKSTLKPFDLATLHSYCSSVGHTSVSHSDLSLVGDDEHTAGQLSQSEAALSSSPSSTSSMSCTCEDTSGCGGVWVTASTRAGLAMVQHPSASDMDSESSASSSVPAHRQHQLRTVRKHPGKLTMGSVPLAHSHDECVAPTSAPVTAPWTARRSSFKFMAQQLRSLSFTQRSSGVTLLRQRQTSEPTEGENSAVVVSRVGRDAAAAALRHFAPTGTGTFVLRQDPRQHRMGCDDMDGPVWMHSAAPCSDTAYPDQSGDSRQQRPGARVHVFSPVAESCTDDDESAEETPTEQTAQESQQLSATAPLFITYTCDGVIRHVPVTINKEKFYVGRYNDPAVGTQ